MNNNRYWSHRICISCRSWLQYYHGSSFQYRLCRSCLQSPVSVVRLWLHQSPVPSIYRSWLQYLPSRPVSPVSVDCLWLHWWLSLLVLCLQYHLQESPPVSVDRLWLQSSVSVGRGFSSSISPVVRVSGVCRSWLRYLLSFMAPVSPVVSPVVRVSCTTLKTRGFRVFKYIL